VGIGKSVLRGTRWTAISSIILAVSAIVKISVLARYLDKSDFGLMALVTFVMGFMNVFNDLGLTVAILHKADISEKAYSSLYWFNMAVGIAFFALIFAITPAVASFYEQPLLNTLIPLIGINLIISGIGKLFNTRERKELEFRFISIVDVIGALSSLVIAIYLAVNGYGVYALVYSLIAQFVITNVILLVHGLRKYSLHFHFKYAEVKPFVRIGIYQVGSQCINYFNRDLDILIIGKFFSADILGGYSLARDLVRKPVSFINPILNKVGAPALSKFGLDKVNLKKYYLRMTNMLASIVIPIYVLLAVFAYPLVYILYGEDFLGIVILVQILCVNGIMRAIGSNIGNLVIASGRTDIELRWNIFVTFITPLFLLIGSQFSIEIVAIMLSLSSLVLFIPSYYLLANRMISLSFSEYTKAYFKINFKQFLKL
jgi:O-antigen/teichoic acid export membrane protein